MSDGPLGDPGSLTWEQMRRSSRSINRRRHLVGGVLAAVLAAGVVALAVHLVTPGSHVRPIARPAGAPNLSRLLLTTSDLPPGWSLLATHTPEQVSATSCLRRFEQTVSTVYHDDIRFTTGAGRQALDTGEVLTQAIGYYGTPDAAAHALRAASTIADRCRHVELRSSDNRASGTLISRARPPAIFGAHAARWTLKLHDPYAQDPIGLGSPSDIDFQIMSFTRRHELVMLTLAGSTAGYPELVQYAKTARQHVD